MRVTYATSLGSAEPQEMPGPGSHRSQPEHPPALTPHLGFWEQGAPIHSGWWVYSLDRAAFRPSPS